MIIQIKGNVKFPITLDPSVWIFDDRKIQLEEAFNPAKREVEKEDPLKKMDRMFNQEIYFQKHIKPPVNKSLDRQQRKDALIHSFVMPFKDFMDNAEVIEGSKNARLILAEEEEIIISIEQLHTALFQFAIDGKQIKQDNGGPVYFYFGDGSNQNKPIKGIKEIIID